ncbi:hypothetical protein [Pantoea sp. 3_1284]|uniref:hypothetical protein n=1 Tax=Pantoea sp. 3_1284 TaxID=2259618 RepID=UPI0018F49ED6|nr:hypothetical protein [Pantoea sp. 3_1284]
MEVLNTKEIEMLAGYATIPMADWGVVTQRSKKTALAPSVTMIKEMIIKTIPFLIISLLAIIIVSKRISEPLTRLASLAESSTENNQGDKINDVHAWYYEAIQLKKGIELQLELLHSPINGGPIDEADEPSGARCAFRTMDRAGTPFCIAYFRYR